MDVIVFGLSKVLNTSLFSVSTVGHTGLVSRSRVVCQPVPSGIKFLVYDFIIGIAILLSSEVYLDFILHGLVCMLLTILLYSC